MELEVEVDVEVLDEVDVDDDVVVQVNRLAFIESNSAIIEVL